MLHVWLVCATICNGQSEIVTIDGIYIERDTVDAKGRQRSMSFPINEKPIIHGDVIVFDIPGFGEHLEASNVSINDVRLLVEGIEMTEMLSFAENLESGIIRFEFNEEDLTADHRQALYNRPGGSLKKLRLGIKVGETTAINYSPKAQFYFDQIDTWEIVGLILVVAFVLTFGTIIVVFPTILKETVPSQLRPAFADYVMPEIEKHLLRSANDHGDEPRSRSSLVSREEKRSISTLSQGEFNQFLDLSKIELAYSFSKSQLVFWTFIVVSSFIYIWGMTNDFNPLNTTALILLGISSVTSAAGSLVSERQATDALTPGKDKSRLPAKIGAPGEDPGENQNVPVKAVQAFLESRATEKSYWRDILSDNNGISIYRVQAFAFNIVYGLIFLKSVVLDYTMPTFDEAELILLGLSNGTYTFLKSSETK